MKKLIAELVNDSVFSVSIVTTGMHFLVKYGHTIDDIRKDALAPIIAAPCYTEEERHKEEDFVALINALSLVFKQITLMWSMLLAIGLRPMQLH